VTGRIVENPEDYKWSSAIFNTTDKKCEFLDPICVDYKGRVEYKKFLNTPGAKEEIEMVKKRTFEGKPIGESGFMKKVSEMLGIVIKDRPKGRPHKLAEKMGCVPI